MTGQSTVTATIPSYAGGSIIAIFMPQGGGSPILTQTSGGIDSNGMFALKAWDNTLAAYSPSTTMFIISVGYNPATSYTTSVVISGDAQDISAAFDNATSPASVNASTINGISITGTPQAGYVPTAINATTATWQDSGGGGIPYPEAGIPNSTGSAWGTSYTPTGTGDILTTTSASLEGTATLGSISLDFEDSIITAESFVGDLTGNATTATTAGSTSEVNGAVIPASTAVLASNGSRQLIAASVTGSGSIIVMATSPALAGTPTAPTASANASTTQVATTAFVTGQAGTGTPIIDGSATVGTSLLYARQDHVHPTDTSRAATASPAFTGTPTAPTATVGTNTTQLATTAFVQTQVSSSLGGTLSNSNVAVSTGAGTGGSASIVGLDGTHQLTVITGTLPTLSAAIATVTFTATRGHISYVVLTPANAATALLTGASMVFMSANSATAYTLSAGTTALTAATTYVWNVVAL